MLSRRHVYTGSCHSLGVLNEVGAELVLGRGVYVTHGEVDSAAGSMNVQVRRTC